MSELTGPVPRKNKQPAESKSPSTKSADETARRAAGVMKFNAESGKPPVPKVLFSHPVTGKMTYLCGNASTVGFLCSRTAATCNFIHVLKPQDLKRPVDRDALHAFITTHADLSFARPGT